MAAQAPPSLGVSRQEHWSGLPFPSPMHESEKLKWSQISDTFSKDLLPPWKGQGKQKHLFCLYQSSHVQIYLVVQSLSVFNFLCRMDCSMPDCPVLHYLLEFAQTHVHWVSDAIQPSHPLSSPSPPAFSLSQHQGLFQWVSSSHQVAKVLEFQLQHQSFQWIFRTDLL